MPRFRSLAVSWLVLAGTGGSTASCDREERPVAAPERSVDKRTLFGDPALVPTRAGERTRAELAWAGEIEAAVRVLPSVLAVRVHVAQAGDAGPSSITATIRAKALTDLDELRAAVQQTIVGIGGPRAADGATIVIEAEPAPARDPNEPSSPLAWPFVAALLGFGVSLGVTVERLRRRRPSSRRRDPDHDRS